MLYNMFLLFFSCFNVFYDFIAGNQMLKYDILLIINYFSFIQVCERPIQPPLSSEPRTVRLPVLLSMLILQR